MTSICHEGEALHAGKPNMSAAVLMLLTIFFTLPSNPVHAQIPTPTVLYSFQGGTTDLYYPTGIVAQGRDGNLYGTAQSRGANGLGGVYKITPSGTESLIASFTWQGCQGLSLGFDGNFYGTCAFGGANKDGLVFQVTPAGVLTDIYDFTGIHNDAEPATVPVLGANGDFYGTTGQTNYACGNIYRVTTAGAYKNIKSGPGFCTPTQISAASNGDFYGGWGNTPTAGNRGAIFKVTESGTYKEIYDFSGTGVSEYPSTGPILASDGKLYGNDSGGGEYGYGAIYSLTTNGKTLTDLYNINVDPNDGSLWPNNLLQASNGNFYGASYAGGSGNQGSFYELTSDNVFSAFVLDDNSLYGDSPLTSVMQHTNGTLYSTTTANGVDGYGEFMSFDIGASAFISLVGPVPSGTEGTQVQILGQDFTSSSVVKFGGVASTDVQLTGSTFIEATVPSGALTGSITVTTASGTLSTLATFDVTPTVASFDPPSGSANTSVTITGTGLTQATEVKFGGKKASFKVNSDSQITATVPTGASTGKISVTTKGGTATSKSKFTVN
jgi:uncharacterized repeat protein (TIGR03803 family)